MCLEQIYVKYTKDVIFNTADNITYETDYANRQL